MNSRNFKLMVLVTFFYGLLCPVMAWDQTEKILYRGVMPNGDACELEVVKSPTFKPVKIYNITARETTYSIFILPGETHTETELMNQRRGYWGETLGGPWIPTFGIGHRRVILDVVEEDEVPLSFELDVRKIFVRDIICDDLREV